MSQQLLAHIDSEKLNEMPMVDIAFELLKATNRPYHFRELMNELAAIRGYSDEQAMNIMAQVYTEINIDGRFVCIGDNTWGLKRWYPTDTVEETQEGGTKKRKLVLDDDFDDDYDIEEELVEDYEEEDIAAYDEDVDEFIDETDLGDDDLLDVEEEELFEDEELAEEELEEGLGEENEEL